MLITSSDLLITLSNMRITPLDSRITRSNLRKSYLKLHKTFAELIPCLMLVAVLCLCLYVPESKECIGLELARSTVECMHNMPHSSFYHFVREVLAEVTSK